MKSWVSMKSLAVMWVCSFRVCGRGSRGAGWGVGWREAGCGGAGAAARAVAGEGWRVGSAVAWRGGGGTAPATGAGRGAAMGPGPGAAGSSAAGGLLLGDAVDVAAAEEDLPAGHGDDAAGANSSVYAATAACVVRVVEDGQHDDVVADVGVHVGAGQPVAGLSGQGPLDRVDAGWTPPR